MIHIENYIFSYNGWCGWNIDFSASCAFSSDKNEISFICKRNLFLFEPDHVIQLSILQLEALQISRESLKGPQNASP